MWLSCNFMPFLNSVSVLAGRWVGDNERLCEMEPLHLKRFPPHAGHEPRTVR